MANKYLLRGLVPVPMNGVIATKRVPKSTSSVLAVMLGSPVLYDAGYALSAVAADSNQLTGTVVALFDSNGKPVNQLVHDAAGYVEITYLQEQIYKITSNDTGIAIGDVGGIGTLVTSGDLADPTDPNQTYSTAVIDGSTINAANAQLEVVGKVDRLDNEYGATGTEVLVRIAPSRYQAA